MNLKNIMSKRIDLIMKKNRSSDVTKIRISNEATNVVSWFDFNKEDVKLSKKIIEENKEPIRIKSIIWFIPDFDNPFWGGIHTILRFASYFKKKWDIKNCFVVTGDVSEIKVRTNISLAFPNLKDEDICILNGMEGLNKVNEADISICTLWTTAFFSLKFNKVKRKFYFIQDYEPLFYPANSVSAMVEETYRFGFYGLTNTISLKKIYETNYEGKSEYFTPSVNLNVFFPNKEKCKRDVQKVFFYARPDHPRNGFELGISALQKLKLKMGDHVRIVTAGAMWSPQEYGVEGIIENLGLLKYEETADLYRQCDAGLVMMFTRHPSYLPLEFMACGCAVVTNYNPATIWLLHDNENCFLTPASASCISDTLHQCLIDVELREKVVQNAFKTIHQLNGWDNEIEKIYNYICRDCCVSL
jgi:O-antigen biosynthesis protein